MQEQEQEQQAGASASPQDQEKMVQLGRMMGPVTDEFDERVQDMLNEHLKHEHETTDYEKEFGGEPRFEKSYQKMRAAQTGGAGEGLGPEEEAELLAKQEQSLQQRAAAQGQQQAQAAQAQQTSPTPPPAPTGAQGVTQPYPAQEEGK
jgi:hypothetical protein